MLFFNSKLTQRVLPFHRYFEGKKLLNFFETSLHLMSRFTSIKEHCEFPTTANTTLAGLNGPFLCRKTLTVEQRKLPRCSKVYEIILLVAEAFRLKDEEY